MNKILWIAVLTAVLFFGCTSAEGMQKTGIPSADQDLCIDSFQVDLDHNGILELARVFKNCDGEPYTVIVSQKDGEKRQLLSVPMYCNIGGCGYGMTQFVRKDGMDYVCTRQEWNTGFLPDGDQGCYSDIRIFDILDGMKHEIYHFHTEDGLDCIENGNAIEFEARNTDILNEYEVIRSSWDYLTEMNTP